MPWRFYGLSKKRRGALPRLSTYESLSIHLLVLLISWLALISLLLLYSTCSCSCLGLSLRYPCLRLSTSLRVEVVEVEVCLSVLERLHLLW